MKRTSKPTKDVKTKAHFEMGVACMKNSVLRSSKGSTEEGKERAHLKLTKQGGEEKMGIPSNKNLQENDTNRELGLRGRRRYSQIFI